LTVDETTMKLTSSAQTSDVTCLHFTVSAQLGSRHLYIELLHNLQQTRQQLSPTAEPPARLPRRFNGGENGSLKSSSDTRSELSRVCTLRNVAKPELGQHDRSRLGVCQCVAEDVRRLLDEQYVRRLRGSEGLNVGVWGQLSARVASSPVSARASAVSHSHLRQTSSPAALAAPDHQSAAAFPSTRGRRRPALAMACAPARMSASSSSSSRRSVC
jgi:hypothetical protein